MNRPSFLDFKILLASASPRRLALLKAMGLGVRTYKVHVEETFPATLPPERVPSFLAMKKAHATMPYAADLEIVLGGDSIVLLDGHILEKPADHKEAFETLKRLSNQKHQVITGICLLNTKKEQLLTEVTEVWLEPLSQEEITHYITRYQPFDKAGSYGIQEWIGHCKIKEIRGSYNNVMGLPTAAIYRALNLHFSDQR